MRDTKFRLFNKHDKKMYIYDPKWGNFEQGNGWVGGVLLADYEREGRRFAPSNQYQLEPDSCEWMEYIGLFDKNDNEICEGDIQLLDYGRGKTIAVVEWSEKDASFVYHTLKDGFLHACREVDAKMNEIIGNICQNKELLEGIKP